MYVHTYLYTCIALCIILRCTRRNGFPGHRTRGHRTRGPKLVQPRTCGPRARGPSSEGPRTLTYNLMRMGCALVCCCWATEHEEALRQLVCRANSGLTSNIRNYIANSLMPDVALCTLGCWRNRTFGLFGGPGNSTGPLYQS